MKHGATYIIMEGERGDPAYCIRTKARWVRSADLPQFHVMETIETVPRKLIVHLHAIKEVASEADKSN